MSVPRIYLDHNATSPSTSAHLAAVFAVLETGPANASSPHAAGRDASVALTAARRALAYAIGFDVAEIVFVSGGTEANNLGTAGVLTLGASESKKVDSVLSECTECVHAVTTAIEHPSILEPLRDAEALGLCELTVLPVDGQGRLSVETVKAALRPHTRLVSLMAANNETGVRLPVRAFGDWLHAARWEKMLAGVPIAGIDPGVTRATLRALHFHVDGVQAFGKLRTAEWIAPGVDSVSLCAHKLGGLPGVGALALRRGRRYSPPFRGGAQEKNRRAGTENLPGIVSLGLVAEGLAAPAWWDRMSALDVLRARLRAGLSQFPGLVWNTPENDILPTTLNFSLAAGGNGLRGEDILMRLDMEGVCASSGSACSSGANLPSKVLVALGRTDREARDAVRLSLGPGSSDGDIDAALAAFGRIFGAD